MLNPDSYIMNRKINKLIIVFTLYFSSHVIIAGEQTDNGSKRLYESACAQCHALNVIEKTRDGRPGWEDTVHKMVITGAQLSVDEMELVIDHLVQNYGPNAGAPMRTGILPYDSPLQSDGTVTSENIILPAGKGRDLVQGFCHLCHDLGRVVASRRNANDWRRYTKNMIAQSAIKIRPEQSEIIVSYLHKHFGKSD